MAIGYVLAGIAAVVILALWLRTGDNGRRIEAIKRLFFGALYFSLMLVIGSAFGFLMAITWILDIIWEFFTGREGFTPDGQAERLWDYRDAWVRWVVYNSGSRPPLLP